MCKAVADGLDEKASIFWMRVVEASSEESLVRCPLFVGGTWFRLAQAMYAFERAKQNAEDRQAEMVSSWRPSAARMMRSCSRCAPPIFETHLRPPDPALMPTFDDARRAELVDEAMALMEFLRAIPLHLRDPDAALRRYQMFVALQRDHPGAWLVPTADILAVYLSHVLRTTTYWKEVEEAAMPPSFRLALSHHHLVAYNEAVQATQTG